MELILSFIACTLCLAGASISAHVTLVRRPKISCKTNHFQLVSNVIRARLREATVPFFRRWTRRAVICRFGPPINSSSGPSGHPRHQNLRTVQQAGVILVRSHPKLIRSCCSQAPSGIW